MTDLEPVLGAYRCGYPNPTSVVEKIQSKFSRKSVLLLLFNELKCKRVQIDGRLAETDKSHLHIASKPTSSILTIAVKKNILAGGTTLVVAL